MVDELTGKKVGASKNARDPHLILDVLPAWKDSDFGSRLPLGPLVVSCGQQALNISCQ
jgi:hypothetical protein